MSANESSTCPFEEALQCQGSYKPINQEKMRLYTTSTRQVASMHVSGVGFLVVFAEVDLPFFCDSMRVNPCRGTLSETGRINIVLLT